MIFHASSKWNFTLDVFLMHKLYLDLLLSLKKDEQILKKGSEKIFKYIQIFKKLQMNIRIYSFAKKSTNEYPNIFVLGKCHEYE